MRNDEKISLLSGIKNSVMQTTMHEAVYSNKNRHTSEFDDTLEELDKLVLFHSHEENYYERYQETLKKLLFFAKKTGVTQFKIRSLEICDKCVINLRGYKAKLSAKEMEIGYNKGLSCDFYHEVSYGRLEYAIVDGREYFWNDPLGKVFRFKMNDVPNEEFVVNVMVSNENGNVTEEIKIMGNSEKILECLKDDIGDVCVFGNTVDIIRTVSLEQNVQHVYDIFKKGTVKRFLKAQGYYIKGKKDDITTVFEDASSAILAHQEMIEHSYRGGMRYNNAQLNSNTYKPKFISITEDISDEEIEQEKKALLSKTYHDCFSCNDSRVLNSFISLYQIIDNSLQELRDQTLVTQKSMSSYKK